MPCVIMYHTHVLYQPHSADQPRQPFLKHCCTHPHHPTTSQGIYRKVVAADQTVQSQQLLLLWYTALPPCLLHGRHNKPTTPLPVLEVVLCELLNVVDQAEQVYVPKTYRATRCWLRKQAPCVWRVLASYSSLYEIACVVCIRLT